MVRLRVLVAIVVVGLVALPTVAYGKHTGTATGRARLHPEEQSGVKGVITFGDNGVDTITISGTATGLDPDGLYVSLIYDNGSVPGGPDSCEPSKEELFGKMLAGFWEVDADGNGTLEQVNLRNEEGDPPDFEPVSYVGLDEFDTISIRQLFFEPEFSAPLRACGQVATHPAG